MNDFKKDFFITNEWRIFGKTMENGRKDSGIKLVTTKARSNFVSKTNYHRKKSLLWKFITNRNEKKYRYTRINQFT